MSLLYLRRHVLALALWTTVSTVAAGAAADDFADGLAAYNRGEYRLAVDIWRPLADGGQADAQAALAFMYLKGLGVVQDDVRAAFWYRRAARRGSPIAQFFLGSLYYFGRGVPRDLEEAYAWCEVALTRGIPDALACRDAAGEGLSHARMLAASRRAVARLGTPETSPGNGHRGDRPAPGSGRP